ncbi:MAG: hypothetical protein HPY66_1608 [Firmicutes bacterium]|nr:hypothetical protein [Bacillota bacterium]
MSYLLSIKDTVQNVADAISAALNMAICIVDDDLVVVGGTAKYRELSGSVLDTNCIYRKVLDSKEKLLLTNPGTNELCRPCRLFNNCPETAEMDCPIIMDGSIIGIISLVSFDEEQAGNMVRNKEHLFAFIERMAELIVSKAKEKQKTDELALFARKVEAIMSSVQEGIIAVNENGKIIHINPSAEFILSIDRETYMGKDIEGLIPGAHITSVLTEGKEYSDIEIDCTAKGRSIRLISTIKPFSSGEEIKGFVVTFRPYSEFSKLAFRMMGNERKYTLDDILGTSSIMAQVKEQAAKAAGSSSTILIRGESGTGKELFARAIHSQSSRKDGPFVTLNCAAIPESLLESELFGYEEGAFTGAKRGGKPGKFELASGGTIFLDEIGDMPLYLQAKLLRVLQEKRIEKVGGLSSIAVDVRVIAATHKDLEGMMAKGEFREDLYYRLNVIPLHIPPLRDRKGDIGMLADSFISKYNHLLGKSIAGMTDEAARAVMSYPWPGNVRELENAIEYASNMCTGELLGVEHLPERILVRLESGASAAETEDIKKASKELEKNIILDNMRIYGASTRDKELIAKKLGISLSTLYRRLRR